MSNLSDIGQPIGKIHHPVAVANAGPLATRVQIFEGTIFQWPLAVADELNLGPGDAIPPMVLIDAGDVTGVIMIPLDPALLAHRHIVKTALQVGQWIIQLGGRSVAFYGSAYANVIRVPRSISRSEIEEFADQLAIPHGDPNAIPIQVLCVYSPDNVQSYFAPVDITSKTERPTLGDWRELAPNEHLLMDGVEMLFNSISSALQLSRTAVVTVGRTIATRDGSGRV
jgi:hypothetical protein